MYQSSAPPSADTQLCPWVVVFMGWASVGFHGLLPSWSGFPWVFVFGSGFHEFLSSWVGFPWVFVFVGLGFYGFPWVFAFLGWVSIGFHGFCCCFGVDFHGLLFFFCLLGVSFHGFLSFWSWFPWVLVFLRWFLWVFAFLRWVSAGFHVFFVVLGWVSMSFHRITAWLGFKGTSRTIKFQSPCPRQGCPLLNHILDQVAQSPIQPGIKYLQRVFSKSRNGF